MQLTFAEAEFQNKKRKTRREKFLEQMEVLIPWNRLQALIAPHYPKAGKGRRPYPLPTMLRVHCLQLFYNLSDPAMEDALYEIESMRVFSGLSLTKAIPDETTILNFRRLLETHQLGGAILQEVNGHLEAQGLLLREGTIMDASIISAPSSTKNQAKERDPEMHQTKKGNQYFFGMTLHIGVDDVHGVIHSLSTTAANVHDLNEAHNLLHGDEQLCWADAGYQGAEKRAELKDGEATWMIAERPGKRKTMSDQKLKAERMKASVRAKVEHPFRRIKQQFGYSKVRYRGLVKNTNRLNILAAFTNLLVCRKYLMA